MRWRSKLTGLQIKVCPIRIKIGSAECKKCRHFVEENEKAVKCKYTLEQSIKEFYNAI